MRKSLIYILFGLSMLAHVFTANYYQSLFQEAKDQEKHYRQISTESTRLLGLHNMHLSYCYLEDHAYGLDFNNTDSLKGIQLIAYMLSELSYRESPPLYPFEIDQNLSHLLKKTPLDVESVKSELLPYSGIENIDSLLSEINRSKVIDHLYRAYNFCGPILWGAKAIVSSRAPIEVVEGDTLEMNVHLFYDSYRNGAFYQVLPSQFILPTTSHDEGILKYPVPLLNGKTPKIIEERFDIHVRNIVVGDTSVFEKLLPVSIKVIPKKGK